MEKLLIPLGIMVGLSILGWLTQKLKNAQDRKQVERERERRAAAGPVMPSASATAGPRAGAADLNRFMEEIDKLRQRGAPGAPPPGPAKPVARAVPKAIPVATPKKKTRLGESAPSTFETTAAPVQSRSINPADDLPVATVVPPTFGPPVVKPAVSRSGASQVTAAVKPIGGATKYKERSTAPTTPFGRQLVALFASPQTLPMAVVLQEILGPPKCKQGPGMIPVTPPAPEGKKEEQAKTEG